MCHNIAKLEAHSYH